MKKIINLCSVALFFSMISCSNEPVEVKKEKEVIVVPEKKEEKPTSITVDKKGVEVESKKVNVKVKPNE